MFHALTVPEHHGSVYLCTYQDWGYCECHDCQLEDLEKGIESAELLEELEVD